MKRGALSFRYEMGGGWKRNGKKNFLVQDIEKNDVTLFIYKKKKDGNKESDSNLLRNLGLCADADFLRYTRRPVTDVYPQPMCPQTIL